MVKDVISNWGGCFHYFLIKDQPNGPLQKQQKKPTKTFVVLNATLLIKQINMNKKKYNKYLSSSKSYNKQYSIINIIIEY
jgi:hypothetical protein